MNATAAHREAYARDGAVLVEGAFADWVAPLTAAFDRALARTRTGEPLPRAGDVDEALAAPQCDWDAASGRAHLRNAVPHEPELRRWLTESPAAALVGELTGANVVQFWYDLWFCKEPASADGATPWHHDATGHPFLGARMPSLWIALGDVGPDDAPLLTFRGSHHDPTSFPPPYAPGKEHLPLPPGWSPVARMREQVEAEPARVQTWLCRAGDCLVIHPQTWHASRPQRNATRRRLACTSRWIGDGLRWEPGPYAFAGFHRDAARLAPGAEPPVDFLPVAWRRPHA